MYGSILRFTCALSTLSLAAFVSPAMAQWFPYSNSCNCAKPIAQTCYQPRPVAQTCYQTVPVTEYQQVRQTVKRPVVETKYVDRQVTEYRQVVEPRTVQVPTLTYQNHTEYRTVQLNAGHWRTRYEPNRRMTPCQYNPTPGLLGSLSRTGYSIRSAFAPRFVTRREYVPKVCTQTYPVTRSVAVRGTRQVTYNVAKLVPYTTTRKVAVNTVKYVDEEVVSMRPVTVMRTVPIGSRTAYLYSPYAPIVTGGSRTALGPTPDPMSDAKAKKNTPERISTSRDKFDRNGSNSDQPKREATNENRPFSKSSYTAPKSDSSRSGAHRATYRGKSNKRFAAPKVASSIVRVTGWRARSVVPADLGPNLIQPAITVARK